MFINLQDSQLYGTNTPSVLHLADIPPQGNTDTPYRLLVVKSETCRYCIELLETLTSRPFWDIPIFLVDKGINSAVLPFFNISGFPTIFTVNKDGFFDLTRPYDGPRTTKALLQAISPDR